MSEIALKFLVANLAAGLAILVVAVLRKPVRAAFGAGLAYGLWLLVPLAALASLLPPRIVEIVRPAPNIAAPVSSDVVLSEPALAANPSIIEEPREVQAAPPSAIVARPLPPIAPASPPLDPWTIAALIWFLGAIAALAWQLRNQSRFMADARAGFAGPAVAGLFKPRIITPADFEDRFDPSEREVVLAHETIHLDRNDARINAVIALARCVCWFNPLVHLAAHLMRIDQELACDAAVVARFPRARSAYASALLKAELAARPLPLGCYWPAKAEHPLMERIEMLKRAVPGRARRLAGAGAIALLAAAAGLTAWAATPPRERFVDAPAATSSEETHVTPAPAPQQTAPQTPQQTPAPAPQQQRPAAQTARQQSFGFPGTSAGFYVSGAPVKLDRDAPILLRGKVEAVDFGDTSYVVRVRATSVSRDRSEFTEYAEPNTSLWELSPTNYFGDPDAIRADLMDKDIEVHGVNLNAGCKPDCRIKVKLLFTPRSSEVPALQPGDSLIAAFTGWYDTNSRITVLGKVERIEFADRTFDAYVRTEARGALPGQLFQARFEYRYPRADIERELTGKSVQISGWRARGDIGTHCTPVCGMFGNSITVRLSPTQAMLIAPTGPTLAMPIPLGPRLVSCPPQGGLIQGSCVTADDPAAAPVAVPRPSGALRIVALKHERLEISSRDVQKFVDRYFEPGEDYSTFGFGNDWTLSTPDGSAFEWRVDDTSLGPLAKVGPVRALRLDAEAPGADLREALIQRNNVLGRYGPNHPEVQKAEALVRDLTKRWEAQTAPSKPQAQPASPPKPQPQSSPQRLAPATPQPIRYEEPQQSSQQPPIRITSNTGNYLQAEGRAVYTGNVQLTQGDLRLATDNLTVTCSRSASGACEEIQSLIADDNVTFTDSEASIRGDHAEYDTRGGAITFTGDVTSSRGNEGVIRGAKMIYRTADRQITVSGDRVTSSPN